MFADENVAIGMKIIVNSDESKSLFVDIDKFIQEINRINSKRCLSYGRISWFTGGGGMGSVLGEDITVYKEFDKLIDEAIKSSKIKSIKLEIGYITVKKISLISQISKFSNVINLHIHFIKSFNAGCYLLAAALNKNNNLINISLSDIYPNDINSENRLDLIKFLTLKHPSLQILDLSNLSISSEQFSQIKNLCSSKIKIFYPKETNEVKDRSEDSNDQLEGCYLKGTKGETFLHYAAKIGDWEYGEFLLIRNPKLSEVTYYYKKERTPFLIAAKHGKIEFAKNFLKVKPNAYLDKDSFKDTAIVYAAKEGHIEFVMWLLTIDADLIKDTDEFGNSAFLILIKKNHIEAAKTLLLKFPEVIFDKNHSGKTGIDLANKNDISLITFLSSCLKEKSSSQEISSTMMEVKI